MKQASCCLLSVFGFVRPFSLSSEFGRCAERYRCIFGQAVQSVRRKSGMSADTTGQTEGCGSYSVSAWLSLDFSLLVSCSSGSFRFPLHAGRNSGADRCVWQNLSKISKSLTNQILPGLTSRSFSSVPFMNYHMEIAGGDFGYDNGKIRCKVLLMKVNRKKSAPFSVFYLH